MPEFKYLDFADALDQLRSDHSINPTEWRALRTITKPYLRGHPMKTIDLMGMSEIASPATIYWRLRYLGVLPKRCEPSLWLLLLVQHLIHKVWLPDLDSNQGPAD